MIQEFLKLTPEEIQRYRTIRRSIWGSRQSIIFFQADGVSAQDKLCIATTIPIDKPFCVEKVSFVFPSGIGDALKVYFLISGDNDTTQKTGFNVLKKYSATEFLVGDGQIVEAWVDPVEFKEGKYIKVWAENSSTTPQDLNAKIEIILYPIWKK